GLEVVLLDFEQPDQLKDPVRLRAYIARYGIEYTVLLAGEPGQLAAKMPQTANLNSFPTTFLLDRSGKVRNGHAGFASPASGKFHTDHKNRVTAEVEHLLHETANP